MFFRYNNEDERYPHVDVIAQDANGVERVAFEITLLRDASGIMVQGIDVYKDEAGTVFDTRLTILPQASNTIRIKSEEYF